MLEAVRKRGRKPVAENGMEDEHTAPPANTIRNPANPDHFMVLVPIGHRVRVRHSGQTVAETTEAVRLLETGKHAYAPRIYVPPAALTVPLEQIEKTTHCPLKGDADYFALDGKEIAWSYRALDFATAIDGYYSFWGEDIRIEEEA